MKINVFLSGYGEKSYFFSHKTKLDGLFDGESLAMK